MATPDDFQRNIEQMIEASTAADAARKKADLTRALFSVRMGTTARKGALEVQQLAQKETKARESAEEAGGQTFVDPPPPLRVGPNQDIGTSAAGALEDVVANQPQPAALQGGIRAGAGVGGGSILDSALTSNTDAVSTTSVPTGTPGIIENRTARRNTLGRPGGLFEFIRFASGDPNFATQERTSVSRAVDTQFVRDQAALLATQRGNARFGNLDRNGMRDLASLQQRVNNFDPRVRTQIEREAQGLQLKQRQDRLATSRGIAVALAETGISGSALRRVQEAAATGSNLDLVQALDAATFPAERAELRAERRLVMEEERHQKQMEVLALEVDAAQSNTAAEIRAQGLLSISGVIPGGNLSPNEAKNTFDSATASNGELIPGNRALAQQAALSQLNNTGARQTYWFHEPNKFNPFGQTTSALVDTDRMLEALANVNDTRFYDSKVRRINDLNKGQAEGDEQVRQAKKEEDFRLLAGAGFNIAPDVVGIDPTTGGAITEFVIDSRIPFDPDSVNAATAAALLRLAVNRATFESDQGRVVSNLFDVDPKARERAGLPPSETARPFEARTPDVAEGPITREVAERLGVETEPTQPSEVGAGRRTGRQVRESIADVLGTEAEKKRVQRIREGTRRASEQRKAIRREFLDFIEGLRGR